MVCSEANFLERAVLFTVLQALFLSSVERHGTWLIDGIDWSSTSTRSVYFVSVASLNTFLIMKQQKILSLSLSLAHPPLNLHFPVSLKNNNPALLFIYLFIYHALIPHEVQLCFCLIESVVLMRS